jgi:hypothetical protein
VVAVIAGDFTRPLGESLGLDFLAQADGWNYIFIEHFSTQDRNLLMKLPVGWQQVAHGYSEDEFMGWLQQHFPAQYPTPAPAPAPVPSPPPLPAPAPALPQKVQYEMPPGCVSRSSISYSD